MLIHVTSFNGLDLNNSYIKTTLLNPLATPAAKISFIEQPGTDSSDADSYTVDVQTKVLSISIKDRSDRYTVISALKSYFKRGTKSDLHAHFTDDDTDYILACRVVNFQQDPTYENTFQVTLQTSQTAWRALEPTVVEWEITGEDSISIEVTGNDETRLIADMSFSSAPAVGYVNQAIYQLPNPINATSSEFFTHYCIEMDTAAIIGDGDMLSSCDDLRVIVDGSEVRRWIADPNTDHTKIWINLYMGWGYQFSLRTAIEDTDDITSIEFNLPTDTFRLSMMPVTGIFYHGTEWISYSNFNVSTGVATVVQRGAYGTTRQTHAANDIFAFIQHAIILNWGNPDAVDPTTLDPNYDDSKPVMNLSASSNSTWVFDSDSGFFDAIRPRRWQTSGTTSIRGNTSLAGYYHISEDDTVGDPVMGIKTLQDLAFNNQIDLRWKFSGSGSPITQVTTTGQKMRETGSINALNFHFSVYSTISNTWVDRWTEAAPSADGTWHAFDTHDDVVFPSDPSIVSTSFSFRMTGTIVNSNNGTPTRNYAEVTGVSIDFDNIFEDASLLTPAPNVTMDMVISNETTGDNLSATYPLLVDKTISINSEESIVTYDGVNFHSAIALNDETRPIFLRLLPGSNTISLAGAVGAGTVTLTWYARRL